MFRIKKAVKDKGGFSLTEMVVVISIIVVLMSLLIPKVIGYIKRATQLSAMNTVRVMVNAMEVSLVEHADKQEQRLDKDYSYYSNGEYIKAGAMTNWMLDTAQNNKSHTKEDEWDFVVAQEILESIGCQHGVKNPKLKFATARPFSQNPKTYKKNNGGKEGAIFIYARSGGVLAAQMTVGDYFVTYRNGNYKVQENSDPNAKFFGAETIKRPGWN